MSGQLEAAVLAWGAARVEALRLRAERASHRCDVHEPGETAPCYLGDEEATADWCDECQKRLPVHREFRVARERVRKAFRRLDTLLRREVVKAAK